MDIYFYNQTGNGDVFYSREFIKDIKNKIGDSHYYIHKKDFSILKDIDIKQIKMDELYSIPDQTKMLFKKDDNLYINTWVGNLMRENEQLNVNLSTNYLLFYIIYETLGIKMEQKDFYIPKINFERIDKTNIDNFFKTLNKKAILVCNGNVLSFQSENFNFDIIINEISYLFKDILFIMTNDTKLSKSNVIKVSDILGYDINNLLEISYISTKTDIIIGRCSGSFCFSHIKENMENHNKKFISINYHKGDIWVDIETNAIQYWSNNFDINEIIKFIENKIKIQNEYTTS